MKAFLIVLSAAALTLPGAADAAKRHSRFSAKLADGQRYSLADKQGRVVLISYWATWCAPCRAELPLLDRYYQAHHAEGFDIVAVSVDDPGDIDAVKAITRTLSFPVAMVADVSSDLGYGTSCKKTRVLGVSFGHCQSGVPLNYVVDRDGHLQLDGAASLDQPDLDREITPLLGPRGDSDK